MGSSADITEEQIAGVREIFEFFSKCHRNLKLYPHYHVHCLEPLEGFCKSLVEYVESHDGLRVAVKQSELQLTETPVYEGQGRENLALGFYMDGLRELSFLPGLTQEAAQDVVFLFHKTMVDLEADSLLFLWEADIPNVDYTALNSLMDPWEPPDYYTPEQVQHLKQMNRDAEVLIEALTVNADCDDYSISPGPHSTAEREPPVPGTQLVLQALGDEDEDPFDTHSDELTELRTSLLAWGPSKLLVNVVGHTFDGLVLAPDVVDFESAEWLFRRAVDLAIDARDPELLAGLLERFKGERELIEGEAAEALLGGLFDSFLEKEFISRLIGMVKGGLQGTPQALCRALGCLEGPGFAAAVTIYLMPRPATLGPPLLEFITKNLAIAPTAVGPLLAPRIPGPAVAELLDQIEKHVRDDDDLTRLLNIAREHPAEAVKERATKLWHKRTSEGQAAVLSRLLASTKRGNRMNGLERVSAMKLSRVLPQLKEQIESAEFLERDAEEQRAFLDVVVKLGGIASVAFLQEQAKRPTGFFGRNKAAKDVRLYAKEALEVLRAERKKHRGDE